MTYKPNLWLAISLWTLFIFITVRQLEGAPQLDGLATLSIMFLAAWIASKNAENNERKKRQYEQIKILNRFHMELTQRFDYLLALRKCYFSILASNQDFNRSLSVPTVSGAQPVGGLNTSELSFLAILLKDTEYTEIQQLPERLRACNPAIINAIAYNFDSICVNWEMRNTLLKDLRNTFNGLEVEKGIARIPNEELKEKVPFSSISNILVLSEDIFKDIESVLQDMLKTMKHLPEESKRLFNKDVLEEVSGLLTYVPNKDMLSFLQREFVPLTDVERKKLSSSDYPMNN